MIRLALVIAGVVGVTVVSMNMPSRELMADSSAESVVRAVPRVAMAPAAMGASGEVRMRFVRAGERVAFPLAIRGGTGDGFFYQWMEVGSEVAADVARPLEGDTLLSPLQPGFYELVISRNGMAQRLTDVRLGVLVPFELKLGASLNGYRIGRYPVEWSTVTDAKPAGFVEIRKADLDLPLTRHLKVRDFVTHDAQTVWPRYAAIDGRLLDKLELVLRELARRRGAERLDFTIRVNSGFRTPSYNAGLEGAARDSRHMYGDAADVVVDTDGDGKMTLVDAYRVEMAVEWVERDHPELVGGLGVYDSARFSTPYCHIDARGKAARWRR